MSKGINELAGKRNRSIPYYETELHIRNEQTVNTMVGTMGGKAGGKRRRLCQEVLKAIRRIETVVPAMAMRISRNDVASETVAELDKLLDAIEAEFNEYKEQVDLMIYQNALEQAVTMHYSKSAYRIPVRITSPRGRRYLDLYELMDAVITKIECLWLTQIFLDPYQHIQGPNHLAKVMRSKSHGIYMLQITVERALREKQAESAKPGEAEAKGKPTKPEAKPEPKSEPVIEAFTDDLDDDDEEEEDNSESQAEVEQAGEEEQAGKAGKSSGSKKR